MQILGPDEGALPALQDTPIFERLLFESPTLLIAVMAIGAIIALFAAAKSTKRKPPAIAALVMLVLAVGTYFTADKVTTDREVITQQAAILIAAIAESDEQAMRSTMAQKVRLGHTDNASSVATRVPSLQGLDQIVAAVIKQLGEQGSDRRLVGSHKVLETRAGMDNENTGRTLIRVRVRGPSDSYLSHSWWEVTWKRFDDQWQATRVEAIWIQG